MNKEGLLIVSYVFDNIKVRSGFKLKQQDKDYILAKGIDVIEEHAEKFIRER